MSSAPTLRIGTRGSALALAQTASVAELIERVTGVPSRLVPIRTEGDDLSVPLDAPSRPGAFVARLRDALLAGAVDVAVHSFKDLPFAPVDGLQVVAVPVRAEARDAVVSESGDLASLASGARVGTSSPRRAAAVQRYRPDLVVVPVRGNVDTRVRKMREGQVEAVIVAAAGLRRLGHGEQITELVDPAVIVPAPAQGALAVEMRADHPLAEALSALDDEESHVRVAAERQVLAAISATCTTAVGAYSVLDGSGLTLLADLTDHLGVEHAQVTLTTRLGADRLRDAVQLGSDVASRLLGRP